MKRYLDDLITRDLNKKMVFVIGPRQVGKTTLSRGLLQNETSASQDQQGVYLNYDVAENRALIEQMNWSRRAPIVVLDEIHKMADWKQWLKGVFDGRQNQQKILVTGSRFTFTMVNNTIRNVIKCSM